MPRACVAPDVKLTRITCLSSVHSKDTDAPSEDTFCHRPISQCCMATGIRQSGLCRLWLRIFPNNPAKFHLKPTRFNTRGQRGKGTRENRYEEVGGKLRNFVVFGRKGVDDWPGFDLAPLPENSLLMLICPLPQRRVLSLAAHRVSQLYLWI